MRRRPANRQEGRAPARWQSGYAGDCKSPYIGSIPVRASKKINWLKVGCDLYPNLGKQRVSARLDLG